MKFGTDGCSLGLVIFRILLQYCNTTIAIRYIFYNIVLKSVTKKDQTNIYDIFEQIRFSADSSKEILYLCLVHKKVIIVLHLFDHLVREAICTI